jgi:hypothetical protein
MPEIDIKRVLDKIRVIEDSLSKLKTLAQLSIDEFISDFKYFDSGIGSQRRRSSLHLPQCSFSCF